MATAGAAFVLGGFFLPWVHGSAEFAARDFSGFDLARLVRNFEVVASSSGEAGKLRVTAVVIYLAPALAVNGAALSWLPGHPRLHVAAILVAAAYALAVLGATAVLSIVSWTELGRVFGGPMTGFWCSLAGTVALAAGGVTLARQTLAEA